MSSGTGTPVIFNDLNGYPTPGIIYCTPTSWNPASPVNQPLPNTVHVYVFEQNSVFPNVPLGTTGYSYSMPV